MFSFLIAQSLLIFFCRTRGFDLRELTIEPSLTINYLRSGVTTDFDRYKKFENSRAKPSRALARHIGFVIYFKIAQTCILRYYYY